MKKIWIFLAFIVLIFISSISFIYCKFDIQNMKEDIENRYSQVVVDNRGKIIGAYLNQDEQWQVKGDGKIPSRLELAVLTFEDREFYNHNGINYLAILRAIKTNIFQKKRIGASTITMQVAKLYKNRNRNYINKVLEIIEAKKIENNIGKEEILKLYLNNAPYGGNIIGYRTASLLYFKKEPVNLTWAEGALLAILPNSPGMMNVEKNREILLKKRNTLLKTMYDTNIISQSQYKLSLNERLPDKRYYFDLLAPHLTRRLKDEYSKEKIINSTIDSEIQKKVDKIVKNYSELIQNKGIKNAAAIVIDNYNGEVKAYIGSQDFYDFEKNGQVDGIISFRSTGSVLKPFLYALSIDDGLIAPQSKLLDIPLYFSNFSPQNANKKYTGLVEAQEALKRSLNIPFVNLLNEYGQDRFFYFLKSVSNFKDNDFSRYGLSLILGTKEMSIENIAQLYYGLANYGNFKNIKYIKNDLEEKNRQLITRGAAYLTINDLSKVQRYGIQNLYTGRDNISWKTGTSYGQRDGWAAGISPKWTVVVWCGNFTGEGNANISGIRTAGVLLFNIFKSLPKDNGIFIKPENDIKKIKIDNQTGYRIKYDVPTREIDYPKDAKPLKLSPYYKKIFINENGKLIDSRDKNFYKSTEKIIVSYPVELFNYLVKENMNIFNISEKTIKFIYPLNGLKIKVPRDFNGKKKVIVKISNPNNYNIFWYLNGEYIGQGLDTERSFSFLPGEQIISIIGENGETSQIKFEVTERK
ncbi:penicillin-binding protein 1C [Fusobacterium hominis]|uniref:peptidoglycan glycosyltransferase n=1 Tax=Fusobacterium hominis TaxID=2764326 RepID=A0A7G9GXP4_9FUSO|nr:penicillin-binding protein 1C [Fusobacterium hominis]QNM15576.1 penicillin-binding protein 1C [Fusobacterium hominis]